MNKLTSDLIVKSYNTYQWELVEEFFFYFDAENRSSGITVPKKFITDFASVPKILWSILPPTGRYTKAALLHDYLYSNYCKVDLSRKECDKMFLKAMQILGVKKSTRTTFYYAVRLFGKKYFKKDNVK